ncbi:MAG: outer membrane beta-barrel protein [Methylovirgula sp.]
MPVSRKDRFLTVTSAAAIFFAAASLAARAQSLTPAPEFGLRGTESAQDQSDMLAPAGGDTSAVTNGNGTDTFSAGAGTAAAPGADASSSDQPSQQNPANVINYGRPKRKKSVLYQLPVVPPPKQPLGYPPLPPLIPYRTAPGTVRKGGGPQPAAVSGHLPPPTVAVIPLLPRPLKPKAEENPYDPLGIDIGSLRLFPYGEVDTGYDDNPNRLADQVQGSTFVHGETGLRLQSLWSQNSLGVNLRAGYYDFQQVPAANQPNADGTVIGRIDVTRNTKINLETRFGLTTQQPGSPLIAIPGSVVITNRPLVVNYGQTIGASHQFNRLTLDLRGSFDRMIFGDATQSDGTMLLLSHYDFNTYAVKGRASYELTPGLIPFVQVTGDERRYDNFLDLYGYARDSNGIAVRAGAKVDMTQLLSGEVSAGYANRVYDDPRLPNVSAPTLDGSLIYTPTALTKVTLTAATELSETTVVNASGAVSHSVTAQISHALLRNLTLIGTGSYQINQYVGAPITEHLYSARLALDYNLTRSIVIRGSYTHSNLSSNLLGDSFTDDVFMVGLKLQR